MISHFIHANFQIPRYSFLFFFSLSRSPFLSLSFPKISRFKFWNSRTNYVRRFDQRPRRRRRWNHCSAHYISSPNCNFIYFSSPSHHFRLWITFFFWDVWNGEASVWWSFYLLGKYSATNRERSDEGEEESWDFRANVSGHPSLSWVQFQFFCWPWFISQFFSCIMKPLQIWLYAGCEARRVGSVVWRISSVARRHRCVSGKLCIFIFFSVHPILLFQLLANRI